MRHVQLSELKLFYDEIFLLCFFFLCLTTYLYFDNRGDKILDAATEINC